MKDLWEEEKEEEAGDREGENNKNNITDSLNQ